VDAELARIEEPPPAEPWLAMVERWTELGLPYRVAYAQWRAAEAMIAAGERGPDVRDLLVAAAATAGRLGARPLGDAVAQLSRRAKLSPSPAADGAAAEDGRAFGLTEREYDVLLLVAAGKTNRAIGQALFMSEKTASVHVSHILAKLGVANRAEAAGVAHTLGIG
jgi:DNA-binding NarL/FixJ family response regulator